MKFIKEENNNWYVVLPEWNGSKDDLQMVMGADIMLDILSHGNNEIELDVRLEDKEGYSRLSKVNDCDLIGGADYILDKYCGLDFHLEVWLCDVTKFIYGKMPDTIYFKKI